MKPKLDKLTPTELASFAETESLLIPGQPYLFIMSFGWAKVGYYVKHLNPNRILVAHCSHFRNANKDYGRLMLEGAGTECEWRYEGVLIELHTGHILQQGLYHGKVHRGRILHDS